MIQWIDRAKICNAIKIRLNGKANFEHLFILLITLFLPLFLYLSRKDYFGDPLVDFGSDVYLADRISKGDLLYQNHLYYYGPLGPLLDATALTIFGSHWSSIFFTHFLAYYLLLVALAGICLKFLSKFNTAILLNTATLCFAFNHLSSIGNYNFISPYRSALTYGFIGSLICLRTIQSQSLPLLFASGFFFTISLFSKLEIAIAIVPTALMYLSLSRVNFIPWMTGACGGVGAVLCLGWFHGQSSVLLIKGTLESWILPLQHPSLANEIFYQSILGAPKLATTLSTGFAFLIILLLLPWKGLPKIKSDSARNYCLLALSLLPILSIYLGKDSLNLYLNWITIAPFFAASLFLFLFLRKELHSEKAYPTVLSLFAFLLSLKVLFFSTPAHYGFVLSLPAFLLFLAFFLRATPVGDSSYARGIWKAYIVVLLIPIFYLIQLTNSENTEQKKVWVSTEKAEFYYYPEFGASINLLNDYFRKNYKEIKSLQVIPEGTFFNFIFGIPSSLPYMSLLPDQIKVYGSENVLSRVKDASPQVIVIFPRLLGFEEFGQGNFSEQYGKEIYQWIKASYELDENLPMFLQRQGIQLFVLRKSAESS